MDKSLKEKVILDIALLAPLAILAYLAAVTLGGVRALESWMRSRNVPAIYFEELVLIVPIASICCAVFFARRCRDFAARCRELGSCEESLRKSRLEVVEKHKELKSIFRQVEVVKNEWERTLDCIGDMVVLADIEGRVHRCNKAFKLFVGKTYSEIKGLEVETLLRSYGFPSGGLSGESIVSCRLPKGKRYELRSYAYTDVLSGDIAGTVIVIHEIADRPAISSASALSGRVSAFP
jgi:PAS domain-containing protein